MALAINNNLMANNVNRNLSGHYGKLSQSTQRLSSGLRVSSAADDAAGLAIRELMRADIAALGQGVRNANDGISMIQTADGALGVIDSKLIRMKELAEQSATDTYTDDQRVLINKEYQAMADEITRIATDTDFNGKKLLNGTGAAVTKATGSVALTGGTASTTATSSYEKEVTAGVSSVATFMNKDRFGFEQESVYTSGATAGETLKYTQVDGGQIQITENNFSVSATSSIENNAASISKYAAAIANNTLTVETSADNVNWTKQVVGAAIATTAGHSMRITIDDGTTKHVDTIENTGTVAVLSLDTSGGANSGELTTTTDATTANGFVVTSSEEISINVHFGSSSATTDSYDVNLGRSDASYLGLGADAGDHVATTGGAKQALENISKAIEMKDATRAGLGATQNRLSATIENVSIQKENLQAAESRISDVDVATEMTEFNKQQILANAAVSMLSQANNLPKMAQKLLG